MTKMAFAGVALVLLAAPLAAQQDGVSSRVIGGLDQRLVQPECKLDGANHFLVRSGKTYLSTGIEGSGDPSNKARAVSTGVRVITEAITTNGQAKNPAAWYYLGRLYLQQGDVVGTDSAFTRAEGLAPDCKADIAKYRGRAWVALVNAGNTFRQQQQDDSAMVMYRAANVISQASPLALLNMADIFNQRSQTDSAIHYFGKAAASTATDPPSVKARNQAVFNHGVLLLNNGRAAEAVTQFRRFTALQPDDVVGQKALAQAFRAAGMPDSAQVIEHKLVEAAPVGGGEGDVSANDLFDIAVKQFNDKDYKDAAATFGRVIAMEPFNRDALFNQANAYLALQDGPNLAAAGEKLVAIEPLSEHDHSLLAQGHKFASNQDGLYKAIVAREALLVDVKVEEMKRTADGATLSGTATGREARDEGNKVLPAKPITITVEFLGDAGSVVASQEVTLNALKPGEAMPFTATATGAGIRFWRYKVK